MLDSILDIITRDKFTEKFKASEDKIGRVSEIFIKPIVNILNDLLAKLDRQDGGISDDDCELYFDNLVVLLQIIPRPMRSLLKNIITEQVHYANITNFLALLSINDFYIKNVNLILKLSDKKIFFKIDNNIIEYNFNELEILNLLFESVAFNPNQCDEFGNTALHYLASNNRIDIIETLLKHQNIDPNIKNHDGNTALYIAALHSNYKAMELLLNHPSTDPNVGTKNKTSLSAALFGGAMLNLDDNKSFKFLAYNQRVKFFSGSKERISRLLSYGEIIEKKSKEEYRVSADKSFTQEYCLSGLLPIPDNQYNIQPSSKNTKITNSNYFEIQQNNIDFPFSCKVIETTTSKLKRLSVAFISKNNISVGLFEANNGFIKPICPWFSRPFAETVPVTLLMNNSQNGFTGKKSRKGKGAKYNQNKNPSINEQIKRSPLIWHFEHDKKDFVFHNNSFKNSGLFFFRALDAESNSKAILAGEPLKGRNTGGTVEQQVRSGNTKWVSFSEKMISKFLKGSSGFITMFSEKIYEDYKIDEFAKDESNNLSDLSYSHGFDFKDHRSVMNEVEHDKTLSTNAHRAHEVMATNIPPNRLVYFDNGCPNPIIVQKNKGNEPPEYHKLRKQDMQQKKAARKASKQMAPVSFAKEEFSKIMY